ncbi:nucleolar protein 6 [Orussus abietinus]|uniref:nucleolar protein 6 n=1 Tax=Orussus abietinus TaxID=222816 RepID=UPI0006268D42|nr:nucleolar protein 6 [Orussus abietinus]XP_012273792.1 nucleolar protein 6 [Orussus abietinus]XP_012273793.1 nucleolar protein 6 [Orussus abietinus]
MRHNKENIVFSDDDIVSSRGDRNAVETDEFNEDVEPHDICKRHMNNKRKLSGDTEVISRKKGKVDKDLYKPPTVEELNQLKETENLYHSNLFRLQIEEILNEVKVKEKYKVLFETWFTKLKQTIESIEETEEYKLSNEKPLGNLDVEIPLGITLKDVRGFYRFLRPSNISLVGSYALGTMIGPRITVDVMIEMPAKLFQKSDCQNYKYCRKRAIYLAYIASNIQCDIAESKTFLHLGDNRKPILKIIPSGKLGQKVTVYLHVVPEESSFKMNRFHPEKNNIKPVWYFDENGSKDTDMTPTPHYNSVVLQDMTMLRTNLENVNSIKEYLNLRNGIILLKIWLAQRQLNGGYDGFGNHVLTMFVIHLLRTRKISTIMSSYQIARNVWNQLAQCDWTENGISMCQNGDNQKQISEYHLYYDCVFIDTTGYHNLAANISKETFSWIREEAHLALKYLDNSVLNSFQNLFMKKVPFYRMFDHLICFHDEIALRKMVEAKSSKSSKLDFGTNERAEIIKTIVPILKKGLASRVSYIGVMPGESKEWTIRERFPKVIGPIYIGLQLNPDFCFNVIDKGPKGNLPEAKEFRDFWDDKSELRRFQDGSICEAVVWDEGKTLASKRIICKKIVAYLLQRKLELSNDNFVYVADQMEEFLTLKKTKTTKFTYGTGEEAALEVILAFNDLEKKLASLTDLPLAITGVQGSSSVLRYTKVFPPLATAPRVQPGITEESENCLILKERMLEIVPRLVHSVEGTIQLSTSGKWPDELEAIQKMKAAFNIQIGEGLRKQYQLRTHASLQHLDVMKEGFVFRLRIAQQKEIALLKQEIGEDGVIKYRDNEESIALETKLFNLPKLNGALHGLHTQQPSFGAACCLSKRWLASQLIDNSHMPDIAVELILAAIYLRPEPYRPPQMPQIAFLRFLESCARNDWSTDPIIVNFNDLLSKEEILEIENLFGTARDTLPPLFIATPYDLKRSLWTKKAPTQVILNRINCLAREALKLFELQLFSGAILDCKPLFRPALTEYDCLIYLEPLLIPRRFEAVDLHESHPTILWHPFKQHSKQKIPVLNFDPVQLFLQELRASYGEFTLFFHDTYGGEVIAVLLRPAALESIEFKVPHVKCRKLNPSGKLVLNVEAMIEDFYILGRGLVKNVQVLSRKA